MKCQIKRFSAMFMAIAMICTIFTGCSGNKTPSSDIVSSVISENENTGSNFSTESGEENTASADSSDVEKSNVKTGSIGGANNNQDKNNSQTVNSNPSTVKKTSLSLKQVMSQMPSKLKNTTIKYYVWYDIKQDIEWPIIEKFMKETGIKVEYEVASYDNFKTLLATKMATDSSPDVIRLLNSSLARIKPLSPISVSGYNFNDTAWDELTMRDYTYNGKCYAVAMKNTPFLDGLVMLYDKSALEEAGCEDPYSLWKKGKWTWSAFEKISKQWITQGNDYYGASRAPAMTFALQQGEDLIKFDGKKFSNNITSPTVAASLTRDIQYSKQRYWGPKTWMMTEFVAGKVGFFFCSVSGMRASNTGFGKLSLRKKLWAVPLPSDGKGTPYQIMHENSAWGIPQGAENAEAVPYFLRYMLDYSNYDSKTLWANNGSEVYDSIRSATNRIDYRCSEMITEDNGLKHYDIVNMIVSVVGNEYQVAAGVEKYTPIVNDAVTKANQELAKLK